MHELVLPEEYLLLDGDTAGHRVVLIGSETLGDGDDTLGRHLMLAFVGELASAPMLPNAIILYNGGVRFAAPDSPAIDDLCTLERHGIDLLVCAESLAHHEIQPPLRAGRPASLAEITDCLMKATVVIRP
ncbi:MAG: hypothetical protein KBA30_00850 [Clostridia bacterium]|nr:hypothetical protein [Clostridia bacterium]